MNLNNVETRKARRCGLFDVVVYDKDTDKQLSVIFRRREYCGALYPEELQGYQPGWKVARRYKDSLEQMYREEPTIFKMRRLGLRARTQNDY